MKIRQVGAELFRGEGDRQTGMIKTMVTFGEIRTRIPSKRPAEDPRLRPRDNLDRLLELKSHP